MIASDSSSDSDGTAAEGVLTIGVRVPSIQMSVFAAEIVGEKRTIIK